MRKRSVLGRGWLHLLLIKRTLRSPSVAIRRDLVRSTGADGANIKIILNGVELPPDTMSEPADRPTFLTIARMEDRYKGHDVLVRALALVRAKVPDVQWVVLGDGQPTRWDRSARTLLRGRGLDSFPWIGQRRAAQRMATPHTATGDAEQGVGWRLRAARDSGSCTWKPAHTASRWSLATSAARSTRSLMASPGCSCPRSTSSRLPRRSAGCCSTLSWPAGSVPLAGSARRNTLGRRSSARVQAALVELLPSGPRAAGNLLAL